MSKVKYLFLGMALVLGTFMMTFSSCPGGGEEEEEIVSAAIPFITSHPTSRDYLVSDTIAALTVSATVSDGGTLSYQWFEVDTFTNTGGTEISGQTNDTFTPGSGEGIKYYYAKVINTNAEINGLAEKNSNPARIRISATAIAPPSVTVTVSETAAQYVRGFGGMSNAFGIGPDGVARYMELKDIDTMFDPDTGLGLKFMRIMIWPYPLSEVVSGMHNPQMGNQIYYELVKKVNSYGGYVIASPWTAPAEYKTNESLAAGGSLKTVYYGEYAKYLRDFAQEMADNDAPIYAISIQNEPNIIVRYDGMEWTSQENLNFIRDYGNFTRNPSVIPAWGAGKAQSHVRVIPGEPHQPNDWYQASMDLILDNPTALANTDIAAYHIYGVQGSRVTVSRNGRLNNAGIETWMTEYNINSGGDGSLYPQDSTWDFVWPFIETVQQVIVNNDSSAYIHWYLKRFYGVVGEGAYTTINGAVLPRGYAFSHFAKYATDTVRIEATQSGYPSVSNFRFSAYQRKTNKVTANENKIMANEDSISVVMYDKRTDPRVQGVADIKIDLPSGFTASNAFGIISNDNQKHAPVIVVLSSDGGSAVVSLPTNSIISVKFLK